MKNGNIFFNLFVEQDDKIIVPELQWYKFTDEDNKDSRLKRIEVSAGVDNKIQYFDIPLFVPIVHYPSWWFFNNKSDNKIDMFSFAVNFNNHVNIRSYEIDLVAMIDIDRVIDAELFSFYHEEDDEYNKMLSFLITFSPNLRYDSVDTFDFNPILNWVKVNQDSLISENLLNEFFELIKSHVKKENGNRIDLYDKVYYTGDLNAFFSRDYNGYYTKDMSDKSSKNYNEVTKEDFEKYLTFTDNLLISQVIGIGNRSGPGGRDGTKCINVTDYNVQYEYIGSYNENAIAVNQLITFKCDKVVRDGRIPTYRNKLNVNDYTLQPLGPGWNLRIKNKIRINIDTGVVNLVEKSKFTDFFTAYDNIWYMFSENVGLIGLNNTSLKNINWEEKNKIFKSNFYNGNIATDELIIRTTSNMDGYVKVPLRSLKTCITDNTSYLEYKLILFNNNLDCRSSYIERTNNDIGTDHTNNVVLYTPQDRDIMHPDLGGGLYNFIITTDNKYKLEIPNYEAIDKTKFYLINPIINNGNLKCILVYDGNFNKYQSVTVTIIRDGVEIRSENLENVTADINFDNLVENEILKINIAVKTIYKDSIEHISIPVYTVEPKSIITIAINDTTLENGKTISFNQESGYKYKLLYKINNTEHTKENIKSPYNIDGIFENNRSKEITFKVIGKSNIFTVESNEVKGTYFYGLNYKIKNKSLIYKGFDLEGDGIESKATNGVLKKIFYSKDSVKIDLSFELDSPFQNPEEYKLHIIDIVNESFIYDTYFKEYNGYINSKKIFNQSVYPHTSIDKTGNKFTLVNSPILSESGLIANTKIFITFKWRNIYTTIEITDGK